MKQSLICVALFCVSASGAAAQSASLCHHAGLTYSQGSMVTMGRSLQKCAITEDGAGVWIPMSPEDQSNNSANCVSGGREFGHGSVLPTGPVNLTCSGGIWYPPKS